MKSNPASRVSVIIPAYGHGQFIAAAVRSALAQSCPPREVIVVNDGSPDDTAEVLRPFVAAGQVRYIEQPNAGQAAARKRGLAEATGELIAFLDDDDLWPTDKLEWQGRVLEADTQLGMVAGAASLIDAAGQPVGVAPVPDGELTLERLVLNNPFLSPGQALVRAGLLQRSGGLRSDIAGADDYDLWLRLSRMTRIVSVNRPCLLYRRHAGSASRHAARLLASTERVVRSHLRHVPSSAGRRRARLEVYRGLYWWLGQSFVRDLRAAFSRADVSGLLGCFRSLGPIGKAIATDPFLSKQVVADLLRR